MGAESAAARSHPADIDDFRLTYAVPSRVERRHLNRFMLNFCAAYSGCDPRSQREIFRQFHPAGWFVEKRDVPHFCPVEIAYVDVWEVGRF